MQRPRLAWLELTTTDGPKTSAFYAKVLGGATEGVDMGDYEDFTVAAPGAGTFGVCSPESSEGSLSDGWVPYFRVDDLDAALVEVDAMGGAVVRAPEEGDAEEKVRFAIVRDPSGHVCALFEGGAAD